MAPLAEGPPEPYKPAPSKFETEETARRSQWELQHALPKTDLEIATQWVENTPRAPRGDFDREFADGRIRKQIILAESYPVDEGGEPIVPGDADSVGQYEWSLGQLGTPRVSDATLAVSEQNGARLVRRIMTEARVEYDNWRITEKLRHQAEHDPLTGLYNQRAWHERVVERALSRQSMAFGVIDFDGFKVINDVLGHARGDQVLYELGNLFRQHSRSTDLVARMVQPAEATHREPPYEGTSESVVGRIGGDEFAFALNTDAEVDEIPVEPLLAQQDSEQEGEAQESEADGTPRRRGRQEPGPLTPEQQVERYIERLREVFEEYLQREENADLRELDVQLGLSVGAAYWDGSEPLTHVKLADYVRDADNLMKMDKATRRRMTSWDTKNPTERAETLHHLRALAALGFRIDTRLIGVPHDIDIYGYGEAEES